jgi:SAM-dependent methyltransferase
MTLRAWVARVPGSVEVYKILKNLRYRTRARLGTCGNVRSLGMTREEAFRYAWDIFEKVDHVLDPDLGWKNLDVLEIGPGDTLGAGLLAIAKGARSYAAIDRFPVSFDWHAERLLYDDILDSLSEEERRRVRDAVEVTPSGYSAKAGRFGYSNAIAIEDGPLHFGDRKFHVIFSNAVLEHVGDLATSLGAMCQLLAPGGVMAHDVDLRSHQRFERHPLHFLEYSPSLWKMMTSHTGEPNRERLPKYRETLRELGFRDVRVTVTEEFDLEVVRRVRGRLAGAFRELAVEDLTPATFRLTARSPEVDGRSSLG